MLCFNGIAFLTEFPEPCEIVWKECQNSKVAQQLFGTGLSKNLFWDGFVGDYSASVTLFVSGSKSKGTVYGRFLRDPDGTWRAVSIAAKTNDSEDLFGLQENLNVPSFSKPSEKVA